MLARFMYFFPKKSVLIHCLGSKITFNNIMLKEVSLKCHTTKLQKATYFYFIPVTCDR